MSRTLSISHRSCGTGPWKPIDLSQYVDGPGLAKAMLQMDGYEVVAEWTNGDVKIMACGLEKQAKAYRERGARVMTFEEFVRGISPTGYLDQIMEVVTHATITKAQEVFQDSVVSKAELQENREHKVAAMVDVDVTEEQAQAYCDMHPDRYGPR